MESVAQRKRQVELAKDGLVIRSAVLYKGNKRQLISSVEEDFDLDGFRPTKETRHSMADTLQFWVQESKLNLPPLSSQTAPYYYMLGGDSSKDASDTSTDWSISSISQAVQEEWQKIASWLRLGLLGASRNARRHSNRVAVDRNHLHHGVFPSWTLPITATDTQW